ncbi:MAG: hypothetical protein AB7U44_05110 [Sulfuricurvum sp.]|uniref:hypothetical protein n=1 Tax=Sulfuricurvum sp. TaxID=2025608 RepID=UPI00260ED324|nr:hypothetical protein [Sulfuricurvum sp.]MDD2839257.1 hypothetical protein [Sulfuricurvum sp.]MDD3595161.1 hypothetical protein [Sulfuricurvum sp.]MDD4884154.1 hypothetical protein [Sulfuricurvum sp.]
MSIKDYIAENKLEWMIVYNAPTDAYKYAYRGCLVVTEGKVITADKSLPPKDIVKQVILATNNDTIDFLACEVPSLNLFEGFFAKYKEFLTPDGKYLLFIPDIYGKGQFVHEGITFNAFSLDESSVWNDLLELADLSKGDLKKMSDKEKIDEVCKEIKRSNLRVPEKTFDEIKAMQREGKLSFGAV